MLLLIFPMANNMSRDIVSQRQFYCNTKKPALLFLCRVSLTKENGHLSGLFCQLSKRFVSLISPAVFESIFFLMDKSRCKTRYMQLLVKSCDAIFKHSILKYFHIISTHNKNNKTQVLAMKYIMCGFSSLCNP